MCLCLNVYQVGTSFPQSLSLSSQRLMLPCQRILLGVDHDIGVLLCQPWTWFSRVDSIDYSISLDRRIGLSMKILHILTSIEEGFLRMEDVLCSLCFKALSQQTWSAQTLHIPSKPWQAPGRSSWHSWNIQLDKNVLLHLGPWAMPDGWWWQCNLGCWFLGH